MRQGKGDAATISAILQNSSDLSSWFIASDRSEMREGIEARREQGLRGKRQGWKENKQDTTAIERSICTDERPSDTNQLKTIKNLKG